VATHRHGCCVLQRCIDFAAPHQAAALAVEISMNALALIQDAYGNYVVQYILDLGLDGISKQIMMSLRGCYVQLSLQKFSSNVVEKVRAMCLLNSNLLWPAILRYCVVSHVAGPSLFCCAVFENRGAGDPIHGPWRVRASWSARGVAARSVRQLRGAAVG
jgi:hypothetical protein